MASALVSCVSTGKYKALQKEATQYDSLYNQSMRTLKTCQETNVDLNKQRTAMKDHEKSMELQLNASNDNNTMLRKQITTLSALSSSQAESIKKSLDNIGAKDNYIQNLQFAIAHRDSVNLAVLLNVKATIGGYGEQDVLIKMEKGVVVIELSDKILFDSDTTTTYTVAPKGKGVLGRLARVLNDQTNVNVDVEGHTDSISMDSLVDNWDISVRRATSIVRILEHDYHVLPSRLTASGQSEFQPVGPNDVPEGRAANRRTRITIIPANTEQLQRLLDKRQWQNQAEPTPAPAAVKPAAPPPAATETTTPPPITPPAQTTNTPL
jgi:chemotaxis protein MotB